MPFKGTEISLSEFAYINPSSQLRKGDYSPLIELAALPLYGRDIDSKNIGNRAFKGSGSRFVNHDVLLARITPCLENGKTAWVSNLNRGVVGHGSTKFIVLAPKLEIADSYFLCYLTRSPDFREFAIVRMDC